MPAQPLRRLLDRGLRILRRGSSRLLRRWNGTCIARGISRDGGPPMSGACRDALSILVVEDDPAVAELVRTVLEQVPDWGATVAHDAAGARRAFERGRIQALLLDVNLPDGSGPELLEALRRDPIWDGPPAILMSADADQPEIGAALRRGAATSFLRKPFEIDRLVEEVRSAVAARRETTGPAREADRGAHGCIPAPAL